MCDASGMGVGTGFGGPVTVLLEMMIQESDTSWACHTAHTPQTYYHYQQVAELHLISCEHVGQHVTLCIQFVALHSATPPLSSLLTERTDT